MQCDGMEGRKIRKERRKADAMGMNCAGDGRVRRKCSVKGCERRCIERNGRKSDAMGMERAEN